MCGIDLTDLGSGITPDTDRAPGGEAERGVLKVLNPSTSVVRGAATQGAIPGTAADNFQSRVFFDLYDPSGKLPSVISVFCDRPRFLVDGDLIGLATGAVSQALKVEVRRVSQ